MTILISGATGNVGRPLVEQLLRAGHRVRALTRNPTTASLPEGVELFKGNLSDTASLKDAFDGVSAAHLISFGDDYAPLDNGGDIAALATAAGVRKVTILKGDLDKTGLDQAIEAADSIEHTFLAPVEFMSNTLEWADGIRENGEVREPFVESKSAMIHDADIAAVAAAVLTGTGHSGRTYWLTGPEALDVRQKVAVLSAVLRRDIRLVEQTQDEVVAQWREQGYSEEDIEFFVMMRTNTPEAGHTPQPTVREVTGKPARAYAEWVRENAEPFGGIG